MNKKNYIIIVILLIIIAVLSVMIITYHPPGKTVNNSPYKETLANNSDDPGTVEVIRNIGNSNSSKKIAYVVGVHPLENETHKTLVKLLPEEKNLNYCYDVYMINVTDNVGSYGQGYSDDTDPGRQNGQNLAYKYVYPEIKNGDYDLALDIHSNIGAYPYKTFVFCPVKEGPGVEYARDVEKQCSNINYYTPDSTTSGPFLTVPLNENGIPAFYFEEYSFASQKDKDEHMLELISAVDGLDF